MKLVLRVATFLLMLWSGCQAQTATLTLEQAVERALRHNSSLAVLRFEPALQEAEVLVEKGAFDPNFQASLDQQSLSGVNGTSYSLGLSHRLGSGITYGVRHSVGPDLLGQSSQRTSLDLRVPLLRGAGGEVNRAGVKIASSRLRVTRLQLQVAALDLASEVEAAYWSLVIAHKVAIVRERAVEQARAFLDMLLQEIEAGSAAPYEVFEAEQNLASREADVEAAKGDIELARQALLRLLGAQGEDVEVSLELPQPDPIELGECQDLALAHRPLLRASEAEVEIMKLRVKVAGNATLPQLDLVASHSLSSTGVQPYSWQAGLRLSVPIGNRVGRGRLRSAKAARDQAAARVEDLRQRVLLEAAQAHTALRATSQQLKASERATVKARQRVEAESERFSAGFATAHKVVLAQQQQLATEEKLLSALSKQQFSLVALRRATGTALQGWEREQEQ